MKQTIVGASAADVVTSVTIADNDLFTGREVKRLLAEQRVDTSPYVKAGEAAAICGMNRSTLKSSAPRYMAQQQGGERPLIRVRRTSVSRGAHWLYHEGDCWACRRDQIDPPTLPFQDDDPTVSAYVAKAISTL